MRRLNAATTVLGLLAALAYLTATSSGGDFEESDLTKSTDTLLKAGDYESALKLVEGFILEHPQKPIGRAMLVRVLAANGQTEKALKAYYQFYKLGEMFSEELLLEVVRGTLNHDYGLVRWYATQVLRELGDSCAVPDLINLLNDEHDGVRVEAAYALSELKDNRAVPALINTLNHEDRRVRSGAAQALGELRDNRALPALIDTLNDEG